MRKVKFKINGKDYEGYYVGVSGCRFGNEGDVSIVVVEDLEGNIYSVPNENVKFAGKPINYAPVKRIDLKLMRYALESLNGKFTIDDLLKLADEKNIIIEESEV